MKKEKRKKKNHKKKSSPFLLLTIITLAIIVLILALFSLDIITTNFSKKPISIQLKDKCSLLFNTILHIIKNDADCDIHCKNECSSQELDFFNSNFTSIENSCNNCTCQCI